LRPTLGPLLAAAAAFATVSMALPRTAPAPRAPPPVKELRWLPAPRLSTRTFSRCNTPGKWARAY
jgi:hypothetical protein